MRRALPLLVKAVLLAVLAASRFAEPLAAQERAGGPEPAPAPSAPILAAGPADLEALARLRAGSIAPIQMTDEQPAIEAAPIGRGGRREAIALMIVGGVGVVTGLIADEDILVIAGAVVGGVGLFFYLR